MRFGRSHGSFQGPFVLSFLVISCSIHLYLSLVFQNDVSGDTGEKWVEEMVKKIDKWQEPPPAAARKALAAPLGEYKKKRGGKRARKQKERMGVTDLATLKNRCVY